MDNSYVILSPTTIPPRWAPTIEDWKPLRGRSRVVERRLDGTIAAKSNGAATIERLWERTMPEPTSGCWIWLGPLHFGYGELYHRGRARPVHRVSYELYKGAIPRGAHLDHLCRIRCCVNPDHLEPVSLKENLRRGIEFQRSTKTHCRHGHPYNETTIWIRPGGKKKGRRECMPCIVARTNAYRRRKKNERPIE